LEIYVSQDQVAEDQYTTHLDRDDEVIYDYVFRYFGFSAFESKIDKLESNDFENFVSISSELGGKHQQKSAS
jgi:hypothetical protein